MTAKTYYEKLKDPRWQKLRLEAMQLHNFTCQSCMDTTSELNVHHKEYFKGHEPWDYETSQLAVLCKNCHEIEHDSFNILKWACSLAPIEGPANRSELVFIMLGYLGVNYDGILSISCLPDMKFYKKSYDIGVEIGRIP